MRLSKDDERAGESISIENQRLMLTKYVEEKGWKIAGEYVDDGYTGTNFDRPEVQRLIDDVHMGRLDIVIVKDLSRFGRNYIEVGRYIDYEFPLYNIRFIALSDNIDTADKNSTAMDMEHKGTLKSLSARMIRKHGKSFRNFAGRRKSSSFR